MEVRIKCMFASGVRLVCLERKEYAMSLEYAGISIRERKHVGKHHTNSFRLLNYGPGSPTPTCYVVMFSRTEGLESGSDGGCALGFVVLRRIFDMTSVTT